MAVEASDRGSFRVAKAVQVFEHLVTLHVRCTANRLDNPFPLKLTLEAEFTI